MWLLAMITIAVFSVRAEEADDDDDIDVPGGSGSAAGGEAEEKPLGFGLSALAVFPKNEDRKVPAGEKVETLIVINNIAGNPEYAAMFVAAHISPLNEFSRFYQNFSGNAYKRVIAPGTQTTIKYTFTPDFNAEPMDFSLVVRVFIQPAGEENKTFAIAAYNSTFTVTEPLGTDPKSVFTLIFFAAIVAAVAYYQMNKPTVVVTGPRSSTVRSTPLEEVEIGKGPKVVKVDKDFVSEAHAKYLASLTQTEGPKRGRNTSPKKEK